MFQPSAFGDVIKCQIRENIMIYMGMCLDGTHTPIHAVDLQVVLSIEKVHFRVIIRFLCRIYRRENLIPDET